jgi:hypothetical protein
MSIYVYLDGEWKPCGKTHMHEAKLPVKEIKIQTQAFSPSVYQLGPIVSIGQFKALAGFHSA